MVLTERAFSKDAKLDEIKGVMNSSGEGKWTVETAFDLQTATPVIAMALLMRYRSLEIYRERGSRTTQRIWRGML